MCHYQTYTPIIKPSPEEVARALDACNTSLSKARKIAVVSSPVLISACGAKLDALYQTLRLDDHSSTSQEKLRGLYRDVCKAVRRLQVY